MTLGDQPTTDGDGRQAEADDPRGGRAGRGQTAVLLLGRAVVRRLSTSSVAVTVASEVPGVVGVPEIVRVSGSHTTPSGRPSTVISASGSFSSASRMSTVPSVKLPLG